MITKPDRLKRTPTVRRGRGVYRLSVVMALVWLVLTVLDFDWVRLLLGIGYVVIAAVQFRSTRREAEPRRAADEPQPE